MTRHAVEQREVIVVPASSSAPLQAGSGEGLSSPSNPVPNLPKPTVARAQPSSAAVESSHHPSGERVDSSGPGGDVPMEVAQAVEPTTKSHAPAEEHDESLVPKRQRGRPATHCCPSRGSPEYTIGCPGCDGRSYRHLLKCQQKRVELALTASCSLRDVRGDVVMEEVPPSPPPAEPPPVLRASEETDAMTQYIRVMKNFPVYQAVPRAEVTCKIWSTRWSYRRRGQHKCERVSWRDSSKFLWTQTSTVPLLGSRSRECCWRWLCRKTSPFCSVTLVSLS